MARHRDGSRAGSEAGASNGRVGTARERLTEAVTELRRLTDDQLFEALERLSEVDDIGAASGVSVDSVRRLRLWSGEYLRLAAELEAAARCCRIIEQELREQIDPLLVGWSGHDPGRHSSEPARKGHHGMSLPGWMKAISQHNHPPHGPPEDEETASLVAPDGLPMASQSPPAQGRPEADVAALMLGPLELDVAGRRVVRWSSLKAKAIFQYLLIHRDRPVRRDVLMELQWPDHTHTSARNNLNVALYSMRNTLDGPWQGAQPVLYQDGCYMLNPELKWWVDRDEFLSVLSQADLAHTSGHLGNAIRHYQGAIQLYRGPLFEDDPAGDWYLPEQRHLNELYLQALERVGEIYFDLGELASAEFSAQLALASDPCCESIHRLLMRCYASENKQQLVTRQYRLCVDALRDELGVCPGGETVRLYRDLTSASF